MASIKIPRNRNINCIKPSLDMAKIVYKLYMFIYLKFKCFVYSFIHSYYTYIVLETCTLKSSIQVILQILSFEPIASLFFETCHISVVVIAVLLLKTISYTLLAYGLAARVSDILSNILFHGCLIYNLIIHIKR